MRRRIAFLLLWPLLMTQTVAADWPRFLGPSADGKSKEAGLAFDWPEAGPRLVWQTTAGEGYAAPSIADGRLFMFDGLAAQQRLRCLNPITGEELWRTEYAEPYEDMYGYSTGPKAVPVIDGDRVYTFGIAGRLRCQSVEDGRLLWEVDTTKRFDVKQNFFGVGSSPVIEGDLLIVPVGGSAGGSGLVAFDKRTGKLRWKATNELASYSSPVFETIGDRRWGFALLRGGLVAFEPASGKVDFEFPWRARKHESVNAANPVVVGDKVLISESYGPGSALLQVKPGGYEVLRKDPPRGPSLRTHWMTPIHHDGYLYACDGQSSGDAELRAVEFETGKVAWSEPGFGRFTLIYADGHLIMLTERGRLVVFEATPEKYVQVADVTPKLPDGEPLIEYPAWHAPVLSDGLLYLRGKDRLVCLRID